MERIRQELNLTDRLEGVAEYFGYSLRRFRDQANAGKILGVTHVPGRGLVFFRQNDYEMTGPVSDAPKKYILPRGTISVAHEICSGASSGLVYQGQFAPKKNHHPEVELMAEPGCSGIIVKLIPMLPAKS